MSVALQGHDGFFAEYADSDWPARYDRLMAYAEEREESGDPVDIKGDIDSGEIVVWDRGEPALHQAWVRDPES